MMNAAQLETSIFHAQSCLAKNKEQKQSLIFEKKPFSKPSSRNSNLEFRQSLNRLNELATNKSNFFLEMEKRKKEYENLGMPKKIIHSESEISRTTDRLYEDAAKRSIKLENMRRQEMLKENQGQVANNQTKQNFQTPIYERTEAFLRKKQESLNKFRIQRELETQSNSIKTVSIEEVTTRLISEANAREKRREAERQQALKQSECRGTPNINSRSKVLAQRLNGGKSFIERQDIVKRESELKSKQLEEELLRLSEKSVTKVLTPEEAAE